MACDLAARLCGVGGSGLRGRPRGPSRAGLGCQVKVGPSVATGELLGIGAARSRVDVADCAAREDVISNSLIYWRRGSESNRRTRLCRPRNSSTKQQDMRQRALGLPHFIGTARAVDWMAVGHLRVTEDSGQRPRARTGMATVPALRGQASGRSSRRAISRVFACNGAVRAGSRLTGNRRPGRNSCGSQHPAGGIRCRH